MHKTKVRISTLLVASIVKIVNTAHIWSHEMFHINWVSQSSTRSPNPSTIEVKAEVVLDDGTKRNVTAYSPWGVQILAWWRTAPGAFISRNSDSLALYSLARYVQKQTRIYPHLQLEPPPPTRGGTQTLVFDDALTLEPDGTISFFNFSSPDVFNNMAGQCIDVAVEAADADYLLLTNNFAIQSDFPVGYLANLTSWYSEAGIAIVPTNFNCD